MRRTVGAMVAAALVAGCGDPAHPGADLVRVTIPPGATVSAVADSLVTRGVIASERMFRWYARFSGNDRRIRAGTFDFRPEMSAREAVRVLVAGPVALQPFTATEGMMLREIADAAAEQLGFPPESVMAAATDPELLARTGARGATLEGYLYPSTYMVRVGADARELVGQMVAGFERVWDTTWNRRLDSLGLTRDELVTLASIVEGEARHEEDRAYVSSVYHNRLRRRMRLQADPTVIYALGRRRRLFERDYATPSPHNTYLIDGLPPSPIGQPSRPSIVAALYPRQSDFLYFVAGPDGRHVFSRTYAQHLATIRWVRNGAPLPASR